MPMWNFRQSNGSRPFRGMPWPSRREMLRFAGVAAVGAVVGWEGVCALGANATATQTLRTAAARVGLKYGSCSDVPFADAPKAYAPLFVEQCELYAPNMSWGTVSPKRDAPDPGREEVNLAFAHEHDLKLTGFHLLWYLRTPKWVDELESADAMRKAIADHVAAMGKHYGDRIYSWNVVNEALASKDGRPDNLRHVAVFEKLGTSVFDGIFRAAQAALPRAIRVYNDYGMDMDNRQHEAKRRALFGLLDEFKRNGTPIDAVGLQSHLRLDGAKFNEKAYRQFLRDIAARGLKILITELDVFDLEPAPDIATRDRDVADMYARFLAVALDEPAVTTVVTWGLSDKYTWLTPRYDPSYKRADGQPSRPLPFDEELNPKPAYDAILKAFQNAPSR